MCCDTRIAVLAGLHVMKIQIQQTPRRAKKSMPLLVVCRFSRILLYLLKKVLLFVSYLPVFTQLFYYDTSDFDAHTFYSLIFKIESESKSVYSFTTVSKLPHISQKVSRKVAGKTLPALGK